MLPAQSTSQLLKSVRDENLYSHLIQQLNKDFMLTNLNTKFELDASPAKLKESLQEVLVHLITNRYDDYLNLMYRIDIGESTLLKIKGDQLSAIIEQLCYVVLKREFQKVWFKNRL